jgi:hypothetical protein
MTNILRIQAEFYKTIDMYVSSDDNEIKEFLEKEIQLICAKAFTMESNKPIKRGKK